MSSGKIAQVVGPVVDVAFAAGDKLPEINNALVVYTDEQKSKRIVLEVALELGEGVVRTKLNWPSTPRKIPKTIRIQ